MKILLINDNPVVSRLLALCTRDEDMVLDEVKSVDKIHDVDYDLLLVNDASYEEKIEVLLASKRIRKKVFISYEEDPVEGFDLTIKKPFLPSQIIGLIEGIDMSEMTEESEEEVLLHTLDNVEEEEVENEELPVIFPLSSPDVKNNEEVSQTNKSHTPEVLDGNEIEKIKALLDMDDEIIEDEPISEDEVEARKVKVIKEQLIADGLEIIEEDAIVEELSTMSVETSKKSKKKQKKDQEGRLSKKDLARIDAAVKVALDKLKPKKLEKLLKGKKIEIKIKLEDEL